MMEKNAYTMANLGLETKDGLQPKRDCGFYMKYFFLFLSLIQFLIILGLVLFMIYSNPLEGTEKHLKGLTNQLQESDKKIKALNEEIGKLKRQINTTEKDSRLLQTQILRLNNTLKLCNNEKTKMKEQQQNNAAALLTANECRFNLQLLNITFLEQVRYLEKQLVTLELKSKTEQNNLVQSSKSWQEKAEKAEKEKNECQLNKLQLQTREQKYQELKSTVVQEIAHVLQNVRTSTEQALFSHESHSCNCHEVKSMFHSVFRNVKTQLDTLAQQLEQKANEVTQENALLQSQKAACQQSLQDRDQQINIQGQQFEWQKQALREAQESQIQQIRSENRKVLEENDNLKLQLQQTKQACINMRINTLAPGNTALRNPSVLTPFSASNPFGTFPRNLGNTGSLGNPGGGAASPHIFSSPSQLGRPSSPVQPSSGSQRNLSPAEQSKLHEILKSVAETGKLSNIGPVNPAGKPSS